MVSIWFVCWGKVNFKGNCSWHLHKTEGTVLIGKDCSLVIGVIGVPPPSLPVTVLENKRNWFIHSSVTVAVYCKVNCVLASVKLSAGSEL